MEELKNSNVVDQTNSLSRDEIVQLKKQNEQLYQQKHVDFKILIVPTLGQISIEEYAEQSFNRIKIGDKNLDNGLLLVIAKNERQTRFEVGYGLEGDMPDILAGRILRNSLVPHLKHSQYYLGIAQTQIQVAKLFGLDLPLVSFDPKPIEQPASEAVLSIAETYDMSEDLYQYDSAPSNHIDLAEPSKHPVNYIIFVIWNAVMSSLILIYIMPLYGCLKAENIFDNGLRMKLATYGTFHLLFCWVITGQPLGLIILCSMLIFFFVLVLNYYCHFYLHFKKYVLQRLKLNWIWVSIIYVASVISLSFFTPNSLVPLMMFLAFLPLLARTLWVAIHNSLYIHKTRYPDDLQSLFIWPLPWYFTSIEDSDSSGGSSSGSSSNGSSSSRSTGGSSGGGGASSSW
ncbi:YgcG family protein [Acinetobacter sp. YH12086]|uniref:TPM domain-containing protein n=1 Tax=Acinetobacter sp. YH12086 TaxID=2601078 RepID=UPI0015D33000|nr:TPM domain-containing protein [Acinetobacter sp. YH12086]